MADALHRTRLELRRSIDVVVEGLDGSPDWIVRGKGTPWSAEETRVLTLVPRRYWTVVADALAEMGQAAKDAVDAAIAAQAAADAAALAERDAVKTRFAELRDEINAIEAATPANLTQMIALHRRSVAVQKVILRSLYRSL